MSLPKRTQRNFRRHQGGGDSKRVKKLLEHLEGVRDAEWYQWIVGGPMYGGVKQPELTTEQYAVVGALDKKKAKKRSLPKVSGASKPRKKKRQTKLL